MVRQPLVWGTLLLLVGTSLIIARLYVLDQRQIVAGALEGTQMYARTLGEFRALNTSEVVARLAGHGLVATADHRTSTGKIPLPVTLTRLIGQKVSQHGLGTSVDLYSDYPFPWRRAEGGPRDAFQREALQSLRRHPDRPFYRVEETQGKPVLRYAIADTMQVECVQCHNHHPDSPKRDWQVGDVRGVLEVSRALAGPSALSWYNVREVGWLLILLVVVSVATVASSILRLTRARLLAEQQSEERALFTAKVAHEIRTPMNGVLGLTELLRRTELSPQQRAYVEAARTSALALRSVANQVTDYSTWMRGHVQIEPREFDLHVLLEEAVLIKRSARGAASITLQIAPEVPRFVLGDSNRLLHVLLNLLRNALHHGEGKAITVTASSTKEEKTTNWIEFSVQDQGPGLTVEEQALLFQPYSQVAGRDRGGAGLGLAISKAVVVAMGGEIGVRSQKGAGATFWFQIPLPVVQGRAAGNGDTSLADKAAMSGLLAGRRILVVDDDKVSREVLFGMLGELGADVDVAETGKDALALQQMSTDDPTLAYDAILLDGHMPELTGPETARAIRQGQARGAQAPIIGVTADSTAEFVSAARQSGFDDFLIKPYTLDQLATLLTRWVPVTEEVSGKIRSATAADANPHPAVIAAFLGRAPEDLARIHKAADRGQAQKLLDAAHTLAGSASFVHAVELVRLCRALEAAANEENWTLAQTLCSQLEAEWERVRERLTGAAQAAATGAAETPR